VDSEAEQAPQVHAFVFAFGIDKMVHVHPENFDRFKGGRTVGSISSKERCVGFVVLISHLALEITPQ
jgi:hypothetical protein